MFDKLLTGAKAAILKRNPALEEHLSSRLARWRRGRQSLDFRTRKSRIDLPIESVDYLGWRFPRRADTEPTCRRAAGYVFPDGWKIQQRILARRQAKPEPEPPTVA